jgi:hypothetical protein
MMPGATAIMSPPMLLEPTAPAVRLPAEIVPVAELPFPADRMMSPPEPVDEPPLAVISLASMFVLEMIVTAPPFAVVPPEEMIELVAEPVVKLFVQIDTVPGVAPEALEVSMPDTAPVIDTVPLPA